MTRAQVLQQLAASKAELASRFGVTGLALFGSVVRDAARADSDVDVLVSFDGPPRRDDVPRLDGPVRVPHRP